MRRAMLAVAVVLVGCGGGQAEGKGAESGANIDQTPGEKCIAQANIKLVPPTNAPTRIDVAAITVRHAGLPNSSDVYWTREEACLRAMEARKQLLATHDWDAVFKKYSDTKGPNHGELYDVTQGDLEPAFANAAFSLKVDELSYPVESKRGFHIIWRKK